VKCESIAFLSEQNRTGWTPLISASSGGHGSVVRLLLENQSDAEAVTDQSKSALFYAARFFFDFDFLSKMTSLSLPAKIILR
jgi:ankyrin repeat protein